MYRILFFKDNEYQEVGLESYLEFDNIYIKKISNQLQYSLDGSTYNKLELNQFIAINEWQVIAYETVFYKYGYNDNVIISDYGNIKIDNTRLEITLNKIINDSKTNLYINQQKCNDQEININIGDVIFLDKYYIIYHPHHLLVLGQKLENTTLDLLDVYTLPSSVYERSPRTLKYFEDASVDLLLPPEKEGFQKKTLIRIILPPIVSSLATVVMSIVSKRGWVAMLGLLATACSLVFSVVDYFNDKKDREEKAKKRIVDYQNYILNQRKILNNLYQNEMAVYNYNYPAIAEIQEMLFTHSTRMYEREIKDDDFLKISLGYTNTTPHYNLKMNGDSNGEKDELNDVVNDVFSQYNQLRNVKKTVDLKESHLGLVGNKNDIHNEMKRMIVELAFFHSYHDLNIVMLTNEEDGKEFEFLNWLPHCHLHSHNLATFVTSNNLKMQVLNSIYQILKMRRTEAEESKNAIINRPHFVIFIDDYKQIMNHPIMEFLQNDVEYGVSLVIGVKQFGELTANIKTVLNLQNAHNYYLKQENGRELNLALTSDKIKNIDFDNIARTFSMYDHLVEFKNDIPDMVTFLEMYDVENVEDLNVYNRWLANNIHKSISVPIGMRSASEYVNLNLHEKAHGPHGLVAGTTGSGKSEIIQTYILSLAVNFSPYEVGFILVDFKGGGMANLFTKLPHLIGTITNLDGTESKRAIASIEAELRRRQQIFLENDVNNINLYNAKFKKGEAKEPLPHLFIICDEFAEIKAKLPEFMDSLVSVARIGRTLGIHLILATQKPSGVVNDQIWSNSKFKLALKVQNEADSKEIIKTPDAAHITQTGRAYLQVGNNEIYELFQSAWSGANYEKVDEEKTYDDRVYKINSLGQQELINEDLSQNEDDAIKETELDVVIDEIDNVFEQHDYQKLPPVCLPSLPKEIINQHLGFEVEDLSKFDNIDMIMDMGIVDIPDKQLQKELSIDLSDKGSLLILGSAGYGKSTCITNCICSLARKNSPELLNFHIIDMGGSGLINLKQMPHVANYITVSDIDKINILVNQLDEIIKQRTKMLNENSCQSIEVYELQNQEKVPRIVVVIDNLDNLKELSNQYINFFEKKIRDGKNLGVYFIIANNSFNNIKFTLQSNLPSRICLYNNDFSDIKMALGSIEYPINGDQYGRALIQTDNNNQIQLFSPFSLGDKVEYNSKLEEYINRLKDKYTGLLPKKIPTMPQNLTLNDLSMFEGNPKFTATFGVDLSTYRKFGLEILPPLFQVVGPPKSGKTNLLKNIIETSCVETYVITSGDEYNELSNDRVKVVNGTAKFYQFRNNMVSMLKDREISFEQLKKEGEVNNIQDYLKLIEPVFIIIDDASDYINNFQNLEDFNSIYKHAMNLGIKFIIAIDSNVNLISSGNVERDLNALIKTDNVGIILGKTTFTNLPVLMNSEVPKKGYGVVCIDEYQIKIRIPKN